MNLILIGYILVFGPTIIIILLGSILLINLFLAYLYVSFYKLTISSDNIIHNNNDYDNNKKNQMNQIIDEMIKNRKERKKVNYSMRKT
jgi:hypothetical protein